MAEHFNELGQPIGCPLPHWTACPRPPRSAMEGRYCIVEPVDPARHAVDLHAANSLDREGRNWTYLPYGPFDRIEDYRLWLDRASAGDDPLFHAIIERRSGRALGVASYMRIDPAAGVIEVGGINYAPPLQRTPAATEAMYLMMRRVFDELSYRRYEWKCDAAVFMRQSSALWTEDERFEFVDLIARNPEVGDLIPGSGGVRKVRWGRQGSGKRGGVRMMYFYHDPAMPLYLLMIYAKARHDDLSPEARRTVQGLVARLKAAHRR